jgi:hypothetical protein
MESSARSRPRWRRSSPPTPAADLSLHFVLPRALRTLANGARGTEDRPYPPPELATVAARRRAASSSPAVPSSCPNLGRAGAANHPGTPVRSGQPRTTTPQVNPQPAGSATAPTSLTTMRSLPSWRTAFAACPRDGCDRARASPRWPG